MGAFFIFQKIVSFEWCRLDYLLNCDSLEYPECAKAIFREVEISVASLQECW